ncbi:hypothetical protein OJ997_00230 [Solirubrobacter phytolaccae]|uniref:Uncharacterized protein n=1 Tax=Solirubrobacter phytolaccae TaxID=1404360 RepID=A0A9X3N5P0_9ACTN|nr:hypothetical protein [Solirubrobacter phytolaccae]MDA0178704.1 hypothetical protein [Solirubrobacter phytolaccae]
MKLSRSVALAVTAGTLALPAAAAAHPGVYFIDQKVRKAGTTCVMPDMACIETRRQYAVANDGYAKAWTEGNPAATAPATPTATNGAPAGRGLINYKELAGSWRGTITATTPPAQAAATRKSWLQYAPAQTDLQAHATCMGAPWDTEDNRLAWQNDPFYNYIPWQKTSAGIGDEADKWIALIKDKVGVDLTTIADANLPAACVTAGGTYYVADTPSAITNEQIAEAVEHATAPLNTQISTLQSQVDQLTNQVGVLEAAAATQTNATTRVPQLEQALTAVGAQLKDSETARAVLLDRPLLASLSAKKFDQGVAMITGKANTTAKVTMTISSNDAKKLKINRTLATKNAGLGAQGAALVDLALVSKAAKAVDKAKGSLKVTITATSGNETSDVTGTLTR